MLNAAATPRGWCHSYAWGRAVYMVPASMHSRSRILLCVRMQCGCMIHYMSPGVRVQRLLHGAKCGICARGCHDTMSGHDMCTDTVGGVAPLPNDIQI